MARTKGQTAKRISPDKTPAENFNIAQMGEWWSDEKISGDYELSDYLLLAWKWRFELLVWEPPFASMPAKDKAILEKGKTQRAEKKAVVLNEIGRNLGKAIAHGDWKHLFTLAKAVEFVNEQWDWRVKCLKDICEIHYDSRCSRFKPLSEGDRLRMTIIREYFFRQSEGNDTARKKRSSFMAHIANIMKRQVDSDGHDAFSKSFDRACESLGIDWKCNKGKRNAK